VGRLVAWPGGRWHRGSPRADGGRGRRSAERRGDSRSLSDPVSSCQDRSIGHRSDPPLSRMS
jgi:hypothetical protein